VHFDEQNFVMVAKPGEKLLRALPNPIPAEMRMSDDWMIVAGAMKPSAVAVGSFAGILSE